MMVVTLAIILALCAVMLMRAQYPGYPPGYYPTPYPAVYLPPQPLPAPPSSYIPAPRPGQAEEIHEEIIRDRYTCAGATEETILTLQSTAGNKLRIKKFAAVLSAPGDVYGHCGGRTPIHVDQLADSPTLSDGDADPVDIEIPVGVSFRLTAKIAGAATVDYYIKYTSTARLQ